MERLISLFGGGMFEEFKPLSEAERITGALDESVDQLIKEKIPEYENDYGWAILSDDDVEELCNSAKEMVGERLKRTTSGTVERFNSMPIEKFTEYFKTSFDRKMKDEYGKRYLLKSEMVNGGDLEFGM